MTLLYSYYIRTVFVLHSYCICTVFVLYSYCICVAFVLHSYLFVMHSYCICAVFVLYWYCICIVFVLHSYCIRSAFVLHSYCIRIVSYCIRTVLYSYCIRIVSYCIRTAFVLFRTVFVHILLHFTLTTLVGLVWNARETFLRRKCSMKLLHTNLTGQDFPERKVLCASTFGRSLFCFQLIYLQNAVQFRQTF